MILKMIGKQRGLSTIQLMAWGCMLSNVSVADGTVMKSVRNARWTLAIEFLSQNAAYFSKVALPDILPDYASQDWDESIHIVDSFHQICSNIPCSVIDD